MFSHLLGVFFAAAIGAGGLPEQTIVSGIVRVRATGAGKEGTVVECFLERPGSEPIGIEMDGKGRGLVEVMSDQRVELLGVFTNAVAGRRFRVVRYADTPLDAAHELWRRAGCNACAVVAASRHASVPADLKGVAPVAGRDYGFKERYLAWTTDAKRLWLATDTKIEQVALDGGILAKTFEKPDGLPDSRVYQMASDGDVLWIVHRGGVASLDIKRGVIEDRPALRSVFARVHLDTNGVWIVADTLTCRIEKDGGKATVRPAIPTADRIRARVEKGVWTPQWARRTAHLVGSTVSAGDRLYACSYGAIYELAGGTWRCVARTGFDPVFAAGRLWYACPQGVGEYSPETGRTEYRQPSGFNRGNPSALLLVDNALWLSADPAVLADGATADGGGLARLDISSGRWDVWTNINGGDASHVGCMAAGDGAVWVATARGEYRTVPVQPGMMLSTYGMFEPRTLALNRYDPAKQVWTTFSIPRDELANRLVCGQYGFHAQAPIRIHAVDLLSVSSSKVFAAARLMPDGYCGGYWPTALQIATRDSSVGPWRAEVVHRPDEIALQGEQPAVLNVSNGELVDLGEHRREAVGHDNVLGVFARKDRHWVVTEGCAAWLDEASGRWNKAAETAFRWYWRATTAVDDGQSLIIGSDRGLICRLDLQSGRFHVLGGLEDRAIERVCRRQDGVLEVRGKASPLGAMPAGLKTPGPTIAADVARFDGGGWTAVTGATAQVAGPRPAWFFRPAEGTNVTADATGNFLFGPDGDGPSRARYYVKEVYQPRFLCASPDGSRLWLSTFTGLVRLDLPKAEKGLPR